MANGSPQIEEGHTRIANELLEVLANTRMPSIGFRVVLWVIRNTYGWRNLYCSATFYKIGAEIGVRDDRVGAAVRSLLRSNVLVKNEAGEIGLQKRYLDWGRDPLSIGPNSGPALSQVGPDIGPKQAPSQGENTPRNGPISRRAKERKKERKFNARTREAGGEPPATPPNSPGLLPNGKPDTLQNRAYFGLEGFKPDSHPMYLRVNFEKQIEYDQEWAATRNQQEVQASNRELDARLAVERAAKAAYNALPQEGKDHLAALKDDAIFNMKRKNRGGRSPNIDPKDLRSYKPMPPPDGPTP